MEAINNAVLKAKSVNNIHKKTAEIYKVIRGKLTLYKDGKATELLEGESNTIKPGEIHYAVGDATWIEATSAPGWISEDHILINNSATKL